MNILRKCILFFFAFITLCQIVWAQDEAGRQKIFNLEKGIAIQGYDPVAYFTEGKAVKGSPSYSVYFQGVTYRFSSESNKNLFKTHPARYEPQYGGWCAYAMGNDGSKVNIDPETFKILDGKLFLFYHSYFNNTLTKWNKDEANLKQRADSNWKKITN
jgi:YHS domain-containing protein